jgi:AIPR protein
VRVLARIYETKDPDLVSKIVLTTNNQNQISSRDLRANDPVQLDMEQAFRNYGYLYERKPRQYETEQIDITRLFTNEYVAQAYLAIVLRSPSDARARKYKVWGELHGKIFAGGPVEP